MTAMPQPADASRVRTVRLLALPVGRYAQAQEHNDGLMREFALISFRRPEDPSDVPKRMLTVVDELRTRFGSFTDRPRAELARAVERGDASIDLDYAVPPEAGPAAAALGELLDEADDYCRRGDLLTLATPPPLVAFRRWYLGEFVDQLAGHPPTPWPDYEQQLRSSSGRA